MIRPSETAVVLPTNRLRFFGEEILDEELAARLKVSISDLRFDTASAIYWDPLLREEVFENQDGSFTFTKKGLLRVLAFHLHSFPSLGKCPQVKKFHKKDLAVEQLKELCEDLKVLMNWTSYLVCPDGTDSVIFESGGKMGSIRTYPLLWAAELDGRCQLNLEELLEIMTTSNRKYKAYPI